MLKGIKVKEYLVSGLANLEIQRLNIEPVILYVLPLF